ncbi:hypothetical protein AB0H83_45350 [Dactylosporangium sp. NPDC050688]|uniref:hypothetical protein n=1 Tax=Dactylosporangium sp. NPDC050688 TaxID=3157217 RepID=UPI0033D6429B
MQAAAVADHITAVRDAVERLDRNLAAYRTAMAAVPGFIPSNAPDTAGIESLERDASNMTGGWKARSDEYVTKAGQLVAQADGVANTAERTYC